MWKVWRAVHDAIDREELVRCTSGAHLSPTRQLSKLSHLGNRATCRLLCSFTLHQYSKYSSGRFAGTNYNRNLSRIFCRIKSCEISIMKSGDYLVTMHAIWDI
jgi:hypothetical protein